MAPRKTGPPPGLPWAAVSGIALGWMVYLSGMVNPQSVARAFKPLYVLFSNKWYVDELYEVLFIGPTQRLCRALAWFDDQVIDRVGVDGTGWVAQRQQCRVFAERYDWSYVADQFHVMVERRLAMKGASNGQTIIPTVPA